ncbi:MAG: hypothetical protein JST00_15460 [Deltaproteobacteria bacterium]|nr:hypothetical protein [Deltaproteobacteria bacterium]
MKHRHGSRRPFAALGTLTSLTSLASLTGLAAVVVACAAAPPQPPPAPLQTELPPAAPPSPPASPAQAPASPAQAPASPASPQATPSPPPASATCTRDDDCVVSTFPGCCSCCSCGPIKAFTKEVEAERNAACARKTCDECPSSAASACAPCKDPAKEGMAARCHGGACVIVETKTAVVACKTVEDCWFDDAFKPIARPPKMRGKKITPCKGGGEHAPACDNGACIVRAYKC